MAPKPEPWLALQARVNEAAVEAVAEYLRTLGANGVAVDPGDRPEVTGYFPPGAVRPALAGALRRFLRCLPGWGLDPGRTRVGVIPVLAEDWLAASRRAFRPMRVGRRLWIIPAWEMPVLPPDALAIRLEPGLAFGTGDHPTTRMCLEAIEVALRPGDTMLDCGTGSGVLAIAAALLGAAAVRAVDRDPLAVAAARAAAAGNGVAGRIRVAEADVRTWIGRQSPATLVVANLDTELLLGLCGEFEPVLEPGGRLIVSGLPAARAPEVEAALARAGLPRRCTRLDGGWAAITAGRGGL